MGVSQRVVCDSEGWARIRAYLPGMSQFARAFCLLERDGSIVYFINAVGVT